MNQKAVRLLFLLSTIMLIFGLVLSAGNNLKARASAAASEANLHRTVYLTYTEDILNISILSPENVTYTTSDIPLTFTVNASISWAGYSLDMQTNVTTVANVTLTNLAQGSHSLIVYANDTTGKMSSSETVYFTTRYVSIPELAFLGTLQGLTEWLPVSSTAHLKIAQHLMDFPATPLFDVTLHLGTLFVVVFYFRKEIKNILQALAHLDFKSEYGQFIPPIIVATIPTGVIGILYAKFLEDTYQTILIFGITFLIGATVLYTSRKGKGNIDKITISVALIMGTAQGLASFPGLSRSGITISTALLLGLNREKAFKFSFLLSIPAIIGDMLFEAYKQGGQFALQSISPAGILVGIVLAMIAGYIAIRLVSNSVRSKKFHYFAFYTWALGIALIALTLSGLLTI